MSAVLLLVLSAYGSDVDPFRPSGSLASGLGTLQGESPYVLGEGFSAGLYGSFAQDLAVQDVGQRTHPLVRSVLPVDMYAAWTIEDRARIELFLPVYAYVDAPVSGYAGAALGDVRIQANIPITERERIGLSLVPRIELPTGTRDAYTRRGFQVGMTAALGGELGDFGWVGNTGLAISEASEFEGVGTGSAFELLGGGWWQARPGFRIGAEAESQIGLVAAAQGTNVLGTGHLYSQTALPSGLALTVGAGGGLIAGVGAPGYRMFAAITYGATQRDQDGDGITDGEDACVTEPEDFDQFEDLDGCPDPDNDNDTIADISDSCPNEPEDFDGFEDERGCPDPDNDEDGVLDVDDACPLEPGDAQLDGCPDRDSDGIRDLEDACPDEPGLPQFDGCPDRDGDRVPDKRDKCPDDPIDAGEDPATSDGCPKLVFVEGERITITQRVEFATGSADIQPESFGLLDTVAALLKRRTGIHRVEVAGHTDNVGSDSYNLGLSNQRAASVLSYLVNKGVEVSRLVAKGYGESSPITTNRTPDGRRTNRRVEFNILERSEPTPVPRAPVPAPAVPKPAPAAPKPAPAPAAPKPAGDLANPFAPQPDPAPDQPTKVEPLDRNPWQEALTAPKPSPAPAPAPAPVPASAPKPAPAPAPAPTGGDNPWGDVLQPGTQAPEPSPTADPNGVPGRLTVYLRKASSAEVYVDNERLNRDAPFERVPVPAGPHKIWVVDVQTGLDSITDVVIGNNAETILLLPKGADGPTSADPAPVLERPEPEPQPEPEPKKQRKGRRARKR